MTNEKCSAYYEGPMTFTSDGWIQGIYRIYRFCDIKGHAIVDINAQSNDDAYSAFRDVATSDMWYRFNDGGFIVRQ